MHHRVVVGQDLRLARTLLEADLRPGLLHLAGAQTDRLGKDEPYFIIRGGDPLSDALVELHAYIGAGQSGAAHDTLERILALTGQNPPRPVGSPKYRETFKISVSMERYRETHGRSH